MPPAKKKPEALPEIVARPVRGTRKVVNYGENPVIEKKQPTKRKGQGKNEKDLDPAKNEDEKTKETTDQPPSKKKAGRPKKEQEGGSQDDAETPTALETKVTSKKGKGKAEKVKKPEKKEEKKTTVPKKAAAKMAENALEDENNDDIENAPNDKKKPAKKQKVRQVLEESNGSDNSNQSKKPPKRARKAQEDALEVPEAEEVEENTEEELPVESDPLIEDLEEEKTPEEPEKPKGKKKIGDDKTKEKNKKKDEKKVTPEIVEPQVEKLVKYLPEDLDCTKLSKKGDKWNLKICSWNVDGYRAWISKKGHEFLSAEQPDIFCIQEVRCPSDKLPSDIILPDYHNYWISGEKDGYAGVGLLSKRMPLNIKFGLDNEELDSEGRIITAEYSTFYVVCTYVPNAGRGLATLPKRLKWNEALRERLRELDKIKPVILCGDMNVAHNEIDLANPKTNKKNAGFTPEERQGMTDLLSDGFVDSFRSLYPDKKNAYTFWTYMKGCRAKNIGWRLDYFILSERLMDNVCDQVLRSDVMGSDHCPLTLFINMRGVPDREIQNQSSWGSGESE